MKLLIKRLLKTTFLFSIILVSLASCSNTPGDGSYNSSTLREEKGKIIADITYSDKRRLPFSSHDKRNITLEKTGSGTLVLDRDWTFKNIGIERGSIYVKNGRKINSNIYISPSGILELERAAKINATTSTHGYSKVHNDSGTLEILSSGVKITGEYKPSKNSTLVFYINPDIVGPYLTISTPNNVLLQGIIKVKSNTKYFSYTPKIITLIEKKGASLKYTDKGLRYVYSDGSVYMNKFITSPESVKVSIVRKNMAHTISYLSGSTLSDLNVSNNIELAFKKLDKAVDSGDKTGISEDFLKTAIEIQNIPKAELLSATKTLSAEIYASSQALSYSQSQALNMSLTDRLNQISASDYEKFSSNVWISGIGARGNLKENGYATGKTNMYGTLIGIDTALSKNAILGLSINRSKLNAEFDKYAGKSMGTSVGISGYGRLEFKNPSNKFDNVKGTTYIQGRIGTDFLNSNVERSVLNKKSLIGRKDVINTIYGELGHDFKNYSFTTTPYFGMGYTSINRSAFKEKTKNKEVISWGLESDAKRYGQTALNFGLRAEYEVKSKTGLKTNINANINHVKNLGDNKLDFKAKYIGLSTQEIDVKGINLPKNTTWIGVGLNTEATERLGLQVNYNAKIEKGGLADSVVSAGVNYRF